MSIFEFVDAFSLKEGDIILYRNKLLRVCWINDYRRYDDLPPDLKQGSITAAYCTPQTPYWKQSTFIKFNEGIRIRKRVKFFDHLTL